MPRILDTSILVELVATNLTQSDTTWLRITCHELQVRCLRQRGVESRRPQVVRLQRTEPNAVRGDAYRTALMNDLVQKLANEVDGLEHVLRKVKALHVNKRAPKDAIRSLARTYFGELRPSIVGRLGNETEQSRLDAAIQELVRMAQARTKVSDYRTTLIELKRAVDDLELRSLRPLGSSISKKPILSQYQRILESLRKVSEPACNSFEQGLLDLQSGDRKSWRGTTVEFREALRETLDALAPDDAVTKQPGFKLESDSKGPTMKQKAVFILRARRSKDLQLKSFA